MVSTGLRPPTQRERIEELEGKLHQLQQEFEWTRSLLSGLLGFDGGWASPEKGGDAIGIKRDRIMQEIYAAEDARSKGQKTLFQYGEHYRNIQDVNSSTPTWKINTRRVNEYFNIPPDQRRIYQ